MRRELIYGVVMAAMAAPGATASPPTIDAKYDAQSIYFDLTWSEPVVLLDDWAFQLFIDADMNNQTGYGGGYEYVVRGVDTSHIDSIDLVEAVGDERRRVERKESQALRAP